MIEVTLYNRQECQLCDEVLLYLKGLQNEFPHTLKVIDIDEDADLKNKYGESVPVVEIGDFRLSSPISENDLRMMISAADETNRTMSKQDIGFVRKSRRKDTWSKADSFTLWFSKHYLAVFNLLVLIYIGLPFLAPVLSNIGAERPAKLIYGVYGIVCHQLSFRSIFLFGDQLVYPRAAAGMEGLRSFAEATGLGEGHSVGEIFAARSFHGNENVGYKVALCQRDVAIYAAILFFGIIYGLTGKKIKPMPWYLWFLIGIVPIGLDGISQIISQPPFNLLPFRESTPLLRIMTGALFGFTTAWFGYPLVEETMVDTRTMMLDKFQRTHSENSLRLSQKHISTD